MTQILILLALVVVSAMLIVYSLLPDRRQQEEKMLRRMAGRKSQSPELLTGERHKSAAQQVMEKVAPFAMKPIMPRNDAEMSTLREKLSQAGYRSEPVVRIFLASKTILGGGLAFLALFIAWTRDFDVRQLFGIFATAAGVGFMLPNLWLLLARSQRAEKIRNGLPDSLDLLVVCVESGLALDAGIQRVSEEMRHVHPELSEELQIATLENQMGVPRTEALEHMARRTGVAEVNTLVAIITQAERFGTSVSKALRTQGDMLRIKRKLRAEERAQKTTVKLMLPLILFIFPSIFVVLLGPAAMQIMKTLGSGGPLSGH